jgi:shikimate dehydrogenase
MHRAAFAALGIQAEYRLCRVPAGDVDEVSRQMRRLGAHGGGNVTVPHKGVAASVVDSPSANVSSLRACNCFWESSPGVLAGENTDVAGVRRALVSRDVGRDRALVLGAGGAAAAACLALSEIGMRTITISNRTPGRAGQLSERLADLGIQVRVVDGAPEGRFDVAINATSLGLNPDDVLPLEFNRCIPSCVLDLVYSREPTRWTVAAEIAGITWIDGRDVLLEQGAACYEHWFGVDAPMEAMRGALFGDSD